MDTSRDSTDDIRGERDTDDRRAVDNLVGTMDDGSTAVDDGDGSGDEMGDSVGDAALTELLRRARGPRDWRTLSWRDAAPGWGELRDWVGWLRAESGFDHRVVPPCWYRHRGLVSMLSALHDHWLAAYDPMGSLLGPGEWHRSLMQLEARLREWAARTGCTLGEHRADVGIAYPADDHAWQAHVADDVAVRKGREQHQRAAARTAEPQDPHLPIPLALVPRTTAPDNAAASDQATASDEATATDGAASPDGTTQGAASHA